MNNLAAILDAERVRQGISVYAVAKRGGVPIPTAQAILGGSTTDPRLSSLMAILAGLGRELSWLDGQTIRAADLLAGRASR